MVTQNATIFDLDIVFSLLNPNPFVFLLFLKIKNQDSAVA